MSEYESKREELIANFRDQDYRESYAEDFLITSLATQIKVIREQRGLTQTKLAEETGTKQTAISRIENVNNTARNIGTLLKIAFKLGCRLKVSVETFGSMIDESLSFSRENLERPSFEKDPVFTGEAAPSTYSAEHVAIADCYAGIAQGVYVVGLSDFHEGNVRRHFTADPSQHFYGGTIVGTGTVGPYLAAGQVTLLQGGPIMVGNSQMRTILGTPESEQKKTVELRQAGSSTTGGTALAA